MSTEVDNYLEHMGIEVGDELKHYGKKGMKWGVRKAEKKAAKAAKKAADAAAAAEEDRKIIAARIRNEKRIQKLDQLAAKTYTERTQKGREEATKTYEKYAEKSVKHPDNMTAAKMTSGEAHAANVNLAVNLGALALVGVGSIALKALR